MTIESERTALAQLLNGEVMRGPTVWMLIKNHWYWCRLICTGLVMSADLWDT